MRVVDNEDYVELARDAIEFGDFKSHSGLSITWKLDMMSLLEVHDEMMNFLSPMYRTLGIELGGMLLALSHDGTEAGIIRKESEGDKIYEPKFYYSRYNPHGRPVVTLVDDVVTTEGSLKRAALILHQNKIDVGQYLCILDRRPNHLKSLKITSLMTNLDLGLPCL